MWSETGGRWGRRTWKLRRRQSGFPFRDKQRDFPWAICPVCGQEQYQEDLPLEEGRCLACRRRARKREEDAMTLREMSVEYRAQAQALESQIKAVPNVADIHFVTKEEALANFKANQERQDLFDNVESDTLRDRYEIHVVDIQLMQETVDQVKDIDGIAKVQASLEIADGFVMLRNVATALAIILVVMLVLISISIIANTIIVPFVLAYVYHLEGGIPYFMLTVGIGEVISCGILGMLLRTVLQKYRKYIFDVQK